MTDKELLELAAKAAGIYARRLPHAWPDRFDDDQWNPLSDDGDALRLAVRLQLIVANEHLLAGCAYCTDADDTNFPTVRSGANEAGLIPDDYAATRRAIVLAAAEIGKRGA
ncbi:hypothetical protein KTD13_16805 [Burkholderia multivorans]|uniref:hypothetical protein n=1 Tax=Burkholderia multivorans TaxID=87883 RepID=UPI001C222905|nr:hypothetical protein [Burkholderia multivorans]MBU9262018.1 hypothetical protein [Burkholderia multivorans]